MNSKGLTKVCINLLIAVVVFIVMYCVNFGLSWINNLSYSDMLFITLPFIGLSVLCVAAFGIVADCIEEKRQREIRKRKRIFVLKRAYRNRNKIVLVKSVPKFELFS